MLSIANPVVNNGCLTRCWDVLTIMNNGRGVQGECVSVVDELFAQFVLRQPDR